MAFSASDLNSVGPIMKSAQVRNLKKCSLLLVACVTISASIGLAGHEETWIDTIPAERLNYLLGYGTKLWLVDLRSANEFRRERLPGARSIPSAELTERFAEIPRTGRVVLYCGCEKNESAEGASFLRTQGYRNVSIMLEGYSDWVKRAYPIERDGQ